MVVFTCKECGVMSDLEYMEYKNYSKEHSCSWWHVRVIECKACENKVIHPEDKGYKHMVDLPHEVL